MKKCSVSEDLLTQECCQRLLQLRLQPPQRSHEPTACVLTQLTLRRGHTRSAGASASAGSASTSTSTSGIGIALRGCVSPFRFRFCRRRRRRRLALPPPRRLRRRPVLEQPLALALQQPTNTRRPALGAAYVWGDYLRNQQQELTEGMHTLHAQ